LGFAVEHLKVRLGDRGYADWMVGIGWW